MYGHHHHLPYSTHTTSPHLKMQGGGGSYTQDSRCVVNKKADTALYDEEHRGARDASRLEPLVRFLFLFLLLLLFIHRHVYGHHLNHHKNGSRSSKGSRRDTSRAPVSFFLDLIFYSTNKCLFLGVYGHHQLQVLSKGT